jgi:sugar/nucleoside kinase (ribokinase family)
MRSLTLNKLSLASFSAICADYYPQQGDVKPGGNSLNFAIHAKRFGAGNVDIAGFIGTDTNAGRIIDLLKKEQINTRYLIQLEGKTASNKIYNTPDGERYSNQDDWQNGVKNSGTFTEKAWTYLLDHDIIAVPYLDKNLNELLRRRSEKQFITVDFLHFDDTGLISLYMDIIDIAFISPSPENIPKLSELAKGTRTLVVAMLGSSGSIAFQGGNEFSQPAFKINKVTDTTGCGDSYQAAFVCSYFLDRNIPGAMYEGTRIASEVLTHIGGA